MESFSELSLNAQFAVAVALIGKTSEGWASVEQLGRMTLTSTVRDSVDAVVGELTFTKQDSSGKTQIANTAQEILADVSAHAATAGVLSGNEEADEIATSHLKYLLLPFLTGLSHIAWQGEHEARLHHLTSAKYHLSAFLGALSNTGLIADNERERILEANKSSLSAMQARDEKIRRFKAEKAAEGMLKNLTDRLGKMGLDDDGDSELEETTREATLIVLQNAIIRTENILDSVYREMEILSWANKQRSRGIDPHERAQRAREQVNTHVVPGMPSTFRLVSDREQEREKMFRPSHSLPTYTVEQWGAIQAQMLAEKNEQSSGSNVSRLSNENRNKVEDDDDDDAALNRKTMEQRKWDDWKDDHNKGSGNSVR